MKKLILASASPRRIEMMKEHGFNPHVIPAGIDEALPFSMTPEATVMYLAFKKSLHVASLLSNDSKLQAAAEDSIIIAADTAVVYNDRFIGKPRNPDEAFEFLSSMRGDSHHVITGVSLIEYTLTDIRKNCFYDKTTVYFKNYSDSELDAYVHTDEPYDKAGGYAIQGTFKKYVDHIDGNMDNVIGFPWTLIEPLLKG